MAKRTITAKRTAPAISSAFFFLPMVIFFSDEMRQRGDPPDSEQFSHDAPLFRLQISAATIAVFVYFTCQIILPVSLYKLRRYVMVFRNHFPVLVKTDRI